MWLSRLAFVLTSVLSGSNALADGLASRYLNETPYIRSYYYIGGQYVDDGTGNHIIRDQMYVEKLLPVNGVTQDIPLVIIHGQGQTGTNFLNKPDGDPGWASSFIQQGYEVYIVDQTFRGRSPWQPGYGAAAPSTYPAERIQERFTAPQKFNQWPQAVNHTQWPGEGLMGDPIFDAFYSSNVEFINNATYQQSTVQAAGAALLDKIGRPVVLMGHSQGGTMPVLIADARPELTRALILLEPQGPPFREVIFSNTTARRWGLTDIRLQFIPEVVNPDVDLVKQTYPAPDANHVDCILQAESPAPRQLANLASKQILVVNAEASYHAAYDYCTVKFLEQAGCNKTEHLQLGEAGIHGNGHMFFLEKNSDEIQRKIHDWIGKL